MVRHTWLLVSLMKSWDTGWIPVRRHIFSSSLIEHCLCSELDPYWISHYCSHVLKKTLNRFTYWVREWLVFKTKCKHEFQSLIFKLKGLHLEDWCNTIFLCQIYKKMLNSFWLKTNSKIWLNISGRFFWLFHFQFCSLLTQLHF